MPLYIVHHLRWKKSLLLSNQGKQLVISAVGETDVSDCAWRRCNYCSFLGNSPPGNSLLRTVTLHWINPVALFYYKLGMTLLSTCATFVWYTFFSCQKLWNKYTDICFLIQDFQVIRCMNMKASAKRKKNQYVRLHLLFISLIKTSSFVLGNIWSAEIINPRSSVEVVFGMCSGRTSRSRNHASNLYVLRHLVVVFNITQSQGCFFSHLKTLNRLHWLWIPIRQICNMFIQYYSRLLETLKSQHIPVMWYCHCSYF